MRKAITVFSIIMYVPFTRLAFNRCFELFMLLDCTNIPVSGQVPVVCELTAINSTFKNYSTGILSKARNILQFKLYSAKKCPFVGYNANVCIRFVIYMSHSISRTWDIF